MKNAEMKTRQLQRKIMAERAEMDKAQQSMMRILEKGDNEHEIATWLPQYSKKYAEAFEKVKALTEMIDMIEEIMDEEEE